MAEEYESLGSSSVGVQMSAGALAGVMEHSAMFPFDSVKTRMQSLSAGTNGPFTTLFQMVQKEGALRPLRGMGVMVLGAGPAHAMYFSCYEQIKEFAKARLTSSPTAQPFIHGVSGVFATLLHDGIMTPADAVKQRMQMANSTLGSSWECIRKMYGREGAGAFYRSYTTQLSMNVPFQSIHFIVYELLQDLTNKERKYNPKAHLLSGAIAGATAAAITTPLDVCKTVLNTQDSVALKQLGKAQVSGLVDAGRTVFRVGGAKGFFRGLSARVLTQMPATALSWSVYEFFKFLLREEVPAAEEYHNPYHGSSKESQQHNHLQLNDALLLPTFFSG